MHTNVYIYIYILVQTPHAVERGRPDVTPELHSIRRLRERERETQTDRDRDRETASERERERDLGEREGQRVGERDRHPSPCLRVSVFPCLPVSLHLLLTLSLTLSVKRCGHLLPCPAPLPGHPFHSIREMKGAPRDPAPRNYFLVWIVKPSGCRHLTSGVSTPL